MSKFLRGAGMFYDLVTSKMFHQHIPTSKEAAEFNVARQFTSAQKKLAIAKATALEKHMLTFSDEDGYVNATSIYVSLIYDWHLSDADAKNLAEAVMQAAYYEGVTGVYMSATGISGRFLPKDARGKLPHPLDSGIYNRHDGLVNITQFARLEKYTIADSKGELWISKAQIRAFIEDWRKQDTRWDDADHLSKAIGYLGSKGEFDLLYSRFVSCNIDGVGYVTLKELLQFYNDSAVAVAEIKIGALPVNESSATSPSVSSSKKILDQIKNGANTYITSVVDNCPSYFPPEKPAYWQNGPANHLPLFSNTTSTSLPTCPLQISAPPRP